MKKGHAMCTPPACTGMPWDHSFQWGSSCTMQVLQGSWHEPCLNFNILLWKGKNIFKNLIVWVVYFICQCIMLWVVDENPKCRRKHRQCPFHILPSTIRNKCCWICSVLSTVYPQLPEKFIHLLISRIHHGLQGEVVSCLVQRGKVRYCRFQF